MLNPSTPSRTQDINIPVTQPIPLAKKALEAHKSGDTIAEAQAIMDIMQIEKISYHAAVAVLELIKPIISTSNNTAFSRLNNVMQAIIDKHPQHTYDSSRPKHT